MVFVDRNGSGKILAEKLSSLPLEGAIVVGLPRGGMAVASIVAIRLDLSLDALVVKKLAHPENPELAIGAVAPDGIFQVDWKMVQRYGIDEYFIKSQIANLNEQIKQKILLYRKGKKPLVVRDRTVILVDDGAATGATMEVGVKWVKAKKAKKIIVAIPIVSDSAANRIKPEVDTMVFLEESKTLNAVGEYYQDFSQVTDEEVVQLIL